MKKEKFEAIKMGIARKLIRQALRDRGVPARALKTETKKYSVRIKITPQKRRKTAVGAG